MPRPLPCEGRRRELCHLRRPPRDELEAAPASDRGCRVRHHGDERSGAAATVDVENRGPTGWRALAGRERRHAIGWRRGARRCAGARDCTPDRFEAPIWKTFPTRSRPAARELVELARRTGGARRRPGRVPGSRVRVAILREARLGVEGDRVAADEEVPSPGRVQGGKQISEVGIDRHPAPAIPVPRAPCPRRAPGARRADSSPELAIECSVVAVQRRDATRPALLCWRRSTRLFYRLPRRAARRHAAVPGGLPGPGGTASAGLRWGTC